MIDSSVTELNPESFTWCVWPCFWQLWMLQQCVSERGHVTAISVHCPFNQTLLCPWASLPRSCNQVIASWRSNSEITHKYKPPCTRTCCRNAPWNEFSLTATSYNTSRFGADWIYSRFLISDSLNSIHTQTLLAFSFTDDLWHIWKCITCEEGGEFSTKFTFSIWYTSIVFVLAQKTNIVFHTDI